MMNQSPPELFAERPIRSDLARGLSYRTRRIITMGVLASVAVTGLCFAFGHGTRQPAEIPVLTADGSYKQKPQEPGGIDIPHQDVQVYQALDENAGAPSQTEHLLPAAETPKTMAIQPQAAAAPVATEAPENLRAVAMEAPAPAIVTTVTPEPVAPAPVAAAPAPVTPQAVMKAAPVAKVAPAKVVAASGVTASKTKPVVQLASVSELSGAEKMAAALQTKYSAFLGGVTLRVVKADLGAKGTFYRIQSPPVSSDMADQICRALENHKAGCLVVRH